MDNKDNKTTNKKSNQDPNKLTIKEKAFCKEYIKTGNGTQAIKKAGYTVKNANVAASKANVLLRKDKIQAEIHRLMAPAEKKAIMDAQEVMELFSAIARGEVKDQFGLDASLNDRLKAMNEIAKRTVDIDNRLKGIPDTSSQIKIDWNMD